MKVQNLLFLKMLVLLFSALLKKFGGLISNVMSLIESKNPHPLSPLGVKSQFLPSNAFPKFIWNQKGQRKNGERSPEAQYVCSKIQQI